MTRLAAQFAAELADQGVVVEFDAAGRPSGEPATVPSVSVVDARGLAIGEQERSSPPCRSSRCRSAASVVLASSSAAIPAGAEAIDVGLLDADGVRAILATYVDDATADDVLPDVLRASGGLPAVFMTRRCLSRVNERRQLSAGRRRMGPGWSAAISKLRGLSAIGRDAIPGGHRASVGCRARYVSVEGSGGVRRGRRGVVHRCGSGWSRSC